MAGASTEFFSFYKNELSGVSKEFKLSPSLSFGLIFYLSPYSNIQLLGEINRAKINDNYDEIINSGHTGARNITQNFDISGFPITINYKFNPVISEYNSYVMIGVGVVYSHLKWEESVYSSIQDDIRTGGVHYNNNLISPMIRLSSGIELEFDKKTEKKFLHSFFLELSFNYFFRSADIFSKVVNQFYLQKEDFSKNYTILPYYFGLYFGIYFNLDFVN